MHPLDGLVEAIDQQAFGDFEDQLAGRHARLVQDRFDPRDEVVLAELHRADIDRQREAVTGPVQHVPGEARFAQHPVAQRHDQATRFGHRDEDVGRHAAAVLAAPAHQQFGAARHAFAVDLQL